MQTINSIRIAADADLVFGTASNVEEWPAILPHYRSVRHIGGQGSWRTFEMAARRSGMPIKWTALMLCDPSIRRIYFRHVGGLTRGMEVEWSFQPVSDGTSVCITHDLSRLRVPIVRSALGKLLTGRVFVEQVADRTLRCMKRWIEAQCGELR